MSVVTRLFNIREGRRQGKPRHYTTGLGAGRGWKGRSALGPSKEDR